MQWEICVFLRFLGHVLGYVGDVLMDFWCPFLLFSAMVRYFIRFQSILRNLNSFSLVFDSLISYLRL